MARVVFKSISTCIALWCVACLLKVTFSHFTYFYLEARTVLITPILTFFIFTFSSSSSSFSFSFCLLHFFLGVSYFIYFLFFRYRYPPFLVY
ncbi:hypothetical protein F4808DRAFT_436495, partial [Astrocystis sublimbata]